MKICYLCKELKPANQYRTKSAAKDGLSSRCKDCYHIRLPKPPDGFKKCSKCLEVLPLVSFARKGSGYSPPCKDCVRKHYSRNSEQYRLTHLKRHGMTLERYNAMLESQGGTCALCERTRGARGMYLDIDHDHSCCPGQFSCGDCVRGLLCTQHNVALGAVNDSVVELQSMIEYLTKAKAG